MNAGDFVLGLVLGWWVLWIWRDRFDRPRRPMPRPDFRYVRKEF